MDADLTLPVPPEYHVLVVRTDFSDDAAFDAACDLISTGDCEGYMPDVMTFEDRRLEGSSPDEVYQLAVDTEIEYLFIADARTITDPEHPLLVLNLISDDDDEDDEDDDEEEARPPSRMFWTVPAEVCAIDANLGISNMDFFEFAESVDPDGVFRGFERP